MFKFCSQNSIIYQSFEMTHSNFKHFNCKENEIDFYNCFNLVSIESLIQVEWQQFTADISNSLKKKNYKKLLLKKIIKKFSNGALHLNTFCTCNL